MFHGKMAKSFVILVIIAIAIISPAAVVSSTSSNGTRSPFKVNNVNKSVDAIGVIPLDDVGTSFGRSALPSGFEFVSGQSNYELVEASTAATNAFIATVTTAWAKHYGLELSPDDFWTAIALGVSQHLGNDPNVSEVYRRQFVDHEGKKTLLVGVERSVYSAPRAAANRQIWADAINGFGGQIRGNTKTDFAEIMTKSFSTTGAIEKTVFSASLMEAMKQYFEYETFILCGIPDILLRGSLADYSDILERIDKLIKLFPDFTWWLKTIRGHMLKVYLTVEGITIDYDWWRQIVFEETLELGCGTQQQITGWIGDFMPYLCSDPSHWSAGGQQSACGKNSGERRNLRSFEKPLLTLTDAVLSDEGRKVANLKLAAGFIGISQNNETKAVRPALGWMLYMKKI